MAWTVRSSAFWVASLAALAVSFTLTYLYGFKDADLEGERAVKKVRLGRRDPVATDSRPRTHRQPPGSVGRVHRLAFGGRAAHGERAEVSGAAVGEGRGYRCSPARGRSGR